MEKREFSSKNIKELARAFGLKVDNVPTIELLNKIKKIVLLEERLDNRIVLTYEEEPVKEQEELKNNFFQSFISLYFLDD